MTELVLNEIEGNVTTKAFIDNLDGNFDKIKEKINDELLNELLLIDETLKQTIIPRTEVYIEEAGQENANLYYSKTNESPIFLRGDIGQWTYHKWSNGDVEFWGRFDVEAEEIKVTEQETAGGEQMSDILWLDLPFSIAQTSLTGTAGRGCVVVNPNLPRSNFSKRIGFRLKRNMLLPESDKVDINLSLKGKYIQ